MVKYQFRMSQRSDGSDVAEIEFDGRPLKATSRHGAIMAISRLLLSAGAPDGPWEGVSSGTSEGRLYGRSIVALAGLSVSETDRQRSFVKWMPRDASSFAKAEE